MWEILASTSAALATALAAWQIYLGRRDANRRAALEHLDKLDDRVQELWSVDAEAARSEILQRYRGEIGDLSATSRVYLGFLNTLDLLAFAIAHGMVDRKLADRYVQTLVGSGVVSPDFLRELQQCCGDTGVYEDLFRYVLETKTARAQLPRNA